MNLLIGMRRPETVRDTVRSLEIRLDPEEIRYMEKTVEDIQVEILDK